MDPSCQPTVFTAIERLLAERSVPYTVLRHSPVYTSEAAAEIRGAPLASGAKALVCKADERYLLLVLPADRKLDSRRVRKEQGWKSLRFADRDEVQRLTGLVPGSIPPFGSLFQLPTLCDPRLGDNEAINFNAGDHSISISMTYGDYVSVEQPQLALIGD